MEIRILGERVSSLERAQAILEEMRAIANSEGIARCLYAITQLAPGTPAATEAAAELQACFGRVHVPAQPAPARISPARQEQIAERNAAIELEARWEKSRADALARSKEMAQAGTTYDAYASQRHRRGRKSHLAAAINQNIHDNPGMGCVWFVIFFVAIVGCMVMVVAGK